MTEPRGASAPGFQIRLMETAGTMITWNSHYKCCAFQTFGLRVRLRSSSHALSLIIHPFLHTASFEAVCSHSTYAPPETRRQSGRCCKRRWETPEWRVTGQRSNKLEPISFWRGRY